MTKPVQTKTEKRATVRFVPDTATEREAKPSRSDTITALMREEGGKTATDLAAAIGWQVHSVRGFISGTLKKRPEIEVVTSKRDGATYYQVRDRAAAQR